MEHGERPDVIDSRIVFRIYAALALLSGSVIVGWGPPWFGTATMGRLFGAVVAASGCWAATLSELEDPAVRRRGFLWFAPAHYIFLFFAGKQLGAISGHGVAANTGYVVLTALTTAFVFAMTRESVERAGTHYQTLSLSAGGATEPLRSRYERQMRQAGAQEERNRLGRELHDSIKQQIFVIQTAAATAQTRFDNDRTGAADALEQIRSSARDAMSEMEVMMDQLRSVPLENAGLVDALKKQCEALGHRTGAKVEFRLGDLPPNEALVPGSHQAILRVAQEALANVGRHARANHVTVSLDSFSDRLELRVQDDGTGFDPFQSQRGMGIANMRARAQEFGGQIELTSRVDGGTTVKLSIPHAEVQPTATYRKQALTWGAALSIVVTIAVWTRSDLVLLAVLIAGSFARYAVAWYRTRNFGKAVA